MTSLTQKKFFGAAIRVVTLALFLVTFGASAALAQTKAYVTNFGDNTVSVISTATNTVTATIPVGTNPQSIAFPVRTQGPTGIDQCKNDGWKIFTNPSFKSQGDCVSFVNHMNHLNLDLSRSQHSNHVGFSRR